MENNQTMKASELRIGNLVLLTKDSFKTSNVYQLDGFDIYKLEESECFDIKPVILTEEWFEKFGFDKKTGWDGLEFYILNGVDLIITLQGFEYNDQIIETVHRLQNLFFALREKELEIKES
jgi:hypothetical protein